jgi:hypothetical protein
MEILNTYYELSGLSHALFLLSVLLLFIGGVWIWYVFQENASLINKVSSIVFVTIAFSIMVSVNFIEKDEYHEIIIRDIDKFDFEKYEIIEQKGRIFVVKEDDD